MRVTSVEFAEAHKIRKSSAASVLKFLESKGAAKVVDKRKTSVGKGRSSNVYEIDEQVTIVMAQ